jgi:hypothetical protein
MARHERSVGPCRPYLHRNWIRAINRSHVIQSHDIETAIQRSQQDSASSLLPKNPTRPERKMRIEPLKIALQSSRREVRAGLSSDVLAVPLLAETSSTEARCRVIVSSRHQGSTASILFADSQSCWLTTYQDGFDSATVTRVQRMKPFLIDEEKLLREQDGLGGYDLSTAYNIRLVFESAGSKEWPPTHLAEVECSDLIGDLDSQAKKNPRLWTLSAAVRNHKKATLCPLKLSKGLNQELSTAYTLEVDVRWGTACYTWEHRRLAQINSLAAARTAAAQPTESVVVLGKQNAQKLANGHQSPLVNGHEDSLEDMPGDELLDGELTPNQRSLRERGGQDYNVKRLFNKALGRDPRPQRRHNGEPKPIADSEVTYRTLASTSLVLGSFGCCVCGARNQSYGQLQAHVLCHAEFDPDPRMGHFATVTRDLASPGSLLRPGIYQLSRPLGPFNLDKYVGGDESWITSRLGPLNHLPQREQAPRQLQVSGVFFLAHSLAAVSMVFTSLQVGQKLWNRRRRIAVVPQTRQPLFDPVSKAQLQPGTEVRPNVHDDAWLIQKHRDMIEDFVDLSASEKQYMEEWDDYMARKKLASDHYLGREILAFVRDRGAWLLDRKTRTLEFAKHMSNLVARGLLDDLLVSDILSHLHEARMQKGILNGPSLNGAVNSAPAPKISAGGCGTCGLPVMGAMQLVCHGQVSP